MHFLLLESCKQSVLKQKYQNLRSILFHSSFMLHAQVTFYTMDANSSAEQHPGTFARLESKWMNSKNCRE